MTTQNPREEQVKAIVNKLVGGAPKEETRAVYGEWAEHYDQDLDFYGYVAPQLAAEMFHEAAGKTDGLIFDIGCGTGLSGVALAAHGYTHIHGGDYSPDMRAKAAERRVYEKLFEIDLTGPLSIPDAHYDHATCIGVYSAVYNQYFMPEIMRILKPGGIFTMTCRPKYLASDLQPQLDALVASNTITFIKNEMKPYMVGQGADAAYITLQKN